MSAFVSRQEFLAGAQIDINWQKISTQNVDPYNLGRIEGGGGGVIFGMANEASNGPMLDNGSDACAACVNAARAKWS